jgi:hypothetical protein
MWEHRRPSLFLVQEVCQTAHRLARGSLCTASYSGTLGYYQNPRDSTDGTTRRILRINWWTGSKYKYTTQNIHGGPARDTNDGGKRPAAAATPWDASTPDASPATGNVCLSYGSIMGRTRDDASSSNASRTWVSLCLSMQMFRNRLASFAAGMSRTVRWRAWWSSYRLTVFVVCVWLAEPAFCYDPLNAAPELLSHRTGRRGFVKV